MDRTRAEKGSCIINASLVVVMDQPERGGVCSSRSRISKWIYMRSSSSAREKTHTQAITRVLGIKLSDNTPEQARRSEKARWVGGEINKCLFVCRCLCNVI